MIDSSDIEPRIDHRAPGTWRRAGNADSIAGSQLIEFRSKAINTSPQIIARPDHCISRNNICNNALKVLYRLKDGGYEAHLVGGGVRDLLLGRHPKDFDIATDATPDQIRKLFRNCRLIGRRFRLAHIHFGREYVEVATFRGTGHGSGDERKLEEGRLIFDNVYGSLEEDAIRRDFTVNGLYYSIKDFAIRDFSTGFNDLGAGLIRLIGDPSERYREDPVRLLRAIRFAAKLGFRIEPESESPIAEMGGLLHDIPTARLFEEVLKLFMTGHAERSLDLLLSYDLFGCLFSESQKALKQEGGEAALEMMREGMRNTDKRIAEGKPVTPAFLFATLLWRPMFLHARQLERQGHSPVDSVHLASDWAISQQIRQTSIPRRFSVPMREIWQLQARLNHRHGKRVNRMLGHPRFRAAYDFLLLRTVEDEELKPLADWWTEIQKTESGTVQKVVNPPRRRRRRRPAEKKAEQPI
jgi:poly(A) polymerase